MSIKRRYRFVAFRGNLNFWKRIFLVERMDKKGGGGAWVLRVGLLHFVGFLTFVVVLLLVRWMGRRAAPGGFVALRKVRDRKPGIFRMKYC